MYWRDWPEGGPYNQPPQVVNKDHPMYWLYLAHTEEPDNKLIADYVQDRQRFMLVNEHRQAELDAEEGHHPLGNPRFGLVEEADPEPRGSGLVQRSKPRNYNHAEHGGGIKHDDWGTSGPQLSRWCMAHGVKGWRGVWSWDNVPRPWRPKDFCVIVNIANEGSETGGTHWVAYRVRGATATYFDSYGQPPDSGLETALMGDPDDPPSNIKGVLAMMGVTSTQHNRIDLQAADSDVCGQYACFFALYGLPRNNPVRWGWASVHDRLHNDTVIRRLVRA
jgi:hypothetical protein